MSNCLPIVLPSRPHPLSALQLMDCAAYFLSLENFSLLEKLLVLAVHFDHHHHDTLQHHELAAHLDHIHDTFQHLELAVTPCESPCRFLCHSSTSQFQDPMLAFCPPPAPQLNGLSSHHQSSHSLHLLNDQALIVVPYQCMNHLMSHPMVNNLTLAGYCTSGFPALNTDWHEPLLAVLQQSF